MNRRVVRSLCLTMMLGAAAPAPIVDDADSQVRLLAEQDAAVTRVGERLSVAARRLCPAGGWATGMIVQARTQYGAAYRAAAIRVLALGDYPTVTFLIEGGAAKRAGVRSGDQIVAVDGRSLAKVGDSAVASRTTDSDRALDAIDAGVADGSAALRILRNGSAQTIDLHATPACRARFEVRAGSDTNASATADRVQVSSDLIDPARADQDLAPLIAHELSHIILRHDALLRGSRGGLLPGFGKRGAALRASEIAADRLSVYLLAMAGYNPADAISFWTRFGKRTDLGFLSDRTHPSWQSRVDAIRAEVARVEAQRSTGAAIAPPADLIPVPSR